MTCKASLMGNACTIDHTDTGPDSKSQKAHEATFQTEGGKTIRITWEVVE